MFACATGTGVPSDCKFSVGSPVSTTGSCIEAASPLLSSDCVAELINSGREAVSSVVEKFGSKFDGSAGNWDKSKGVPGTEDMPEAGGRERPPGRRLRLVFKDVLIGGKPASGGRLPLMPGRLSPEPTLPNKDFTSIGTEPKTSIKYECEHE